MGKLLEFIFEAFDAETMERVEMPDGTVLHAEVQIGDSRIMLGQARDEWPPMPSMLYLYVPDYDAAYAKAIAAGAEKVMEPMDQLQRRGARPARYPVVVRHAERGNLQRGIGQAHARGLGTVIAAIAWPSALLSGLLVG